MAAYNAYNGVACAVHPILKSLTREEWKQDGIVCTDGGAFRMLVNDHHAFSSLAEAAAAAIHAGITQFLDDYRDSVREALTQGLLTEAEVDSALRGNFRVMLKLGLWDPPELVPYTQVGARAPWESQAHRDLSLRAARESIVLLKNEAATLPLEIDSLREVLVIGKLASEVFLDWYSGTPPYTVSPLDGIRSKLGDRVRVEHVDGTSIEAAARAAASADVALVCLGNHPTGEGPWAQVTRESYGKEAVDRRSLLLEDEPLLERVLAANPRTILVLLSSFPYAIEWSQEHVPAIVHSTHNGQELGSALADVLFGDYNPAGRLVQTWPRSIDDLLPMLDYDIRSGRTYKYFEGSALYPFGHGLSYTTFVYSGLETSSTCLAGDSSVGVRVCIENSGERAGDEVVQLYAARPNRVPRMPRKQLLGFQRISLGPGQSGRVELTLRASDLRRWDAERRCFRLDPGPLEIQVGRSSENISLRATILVADSTRD
jgi:beta-glucosidase